MKRLSRSLAFLAALSIAAPALAQPADAPPGGETEKEKEASLRFQRGTEFFRDGEFKLALIEFQKAYELAPNYRVLYNIGQVNLQLNNYASALKSLEKYLKDGGQAVPDARRASVEKDIMLLKIRTATLAVHTNVQGALVYVDDIEVGRTPVQPVLLDAGQHVVRVSANGYEPKTQSLMLAGSESKALEITLETRKRDVVVVNGPQASTLPQTVSFIAAGTLGATSVVFGLLTLNALRDLRDLRESSSIVPTQDLEDAQSRARRLAITTDILAGTAIVAGIVGLYFTIRKPSTPPAAGEKAAARAPVKPSFTLLPSGVGATF